MSTAVIVKSRDSLLTTSSGFSNYRGILNLVIILLVLSNARAALENIIKYGILVDPFLWLSFFSEGSKHTPAILICVGLTAHIMISFLIEKLIAHRFRLKNSASKATSPKKEQNKLISVSTFNYLSNVSIISNLVACMALPPAIIYTNETHPISTSLSLMLVSIVFLKLVSYHMMNFWCRDLSLPDKLQSRTTRAFARSYTPPAVDFGISTNAAKATKTDDIEASNGHTPTGDKHRVQNHHNNNNNNNLPDSPKAKDEQREQVLRSTLAKYPANLSLQDMGTFMVFPTLCYELGFARTQRIRKRFLIKRLVEFFILSQMDLALIQQWIVPTVSNSVLPFRQMQLSHMLERLLKLAVPNHVIWLIWFYLFFHSLLNIVAELTRFADREFYRDWWNSESVYYFWSNWNIPVHKWCARHLYVPLMAVGFSKCQASTTVFFVSAFFHEYLVSVPLKMFRMWAFTGMLIQLPMARFVSSYFNNHFANVAVWVSLIIGQPLCILMYYHDYYVINHMKALSAR